MDINIDNYLRIDLMDMGLVLISTFLIIIIAKKYFWKYVKDYLAAREAHVAEELAQSNKHLQESEQLKLKYEEQLKSAHEEASSIVSKAKMNASNETSEMLSAARMHAEEIKERALQDIEFEKEKVKGQIKEEISAVAFLAAKKVVEKELDESIHKKYVDDFIDQAGDDSWQA